MLVAGTAFWMVLLLTPRVWVDQPSEEPTSSAVPVRTLDQSEDCVWCDQPEARPVDCEETSSEKPIWLHPDTPYQQSDPAPCIEEETDESGPSA